MNNVTAKHLRRNAEAVTIGKPVEETRKRYRLYKKLYTRLKNNNPSQPIKFRKTKIKNTNVEHKVKPYIPLATDCISTLCSLVKKGFVGIKDFKYHPTKGFKRSKGFCPKAEIAYRAGKKSALEQMIVPNGVTEAPKQRQD